MTTKYQPGLGMLLAIPLFALPGCAMLEGGTTSASGMSPTATLGGGASPFMRAGLQPFSLANCIKFEAVPQECERVLIEGR
jgi:hypothetical protein